jgi:hypothetical protein
MHSWLVAPRSDTHSRQTGVNALANARTRNDDLEDEKLGAEAQPRTEELRKEGHEESVRLIEVRVPQSGGIALFCRSRR